MGLPQGRAASPPLLQHIAHRIAQSKALWSAVHKYYLARQHVLLGCSRSRLPSWAACVEASWDVMSCWQAKYTALISSLRHHI